MELYGKRWPHDFTNRFFIGQHMVDRDQNDTVPDVLRGVKPREIVRQLADAGCDLLYFYMSCHMGNCYYPTRVEHGRVHSGIGDTDVFGEVADECVKRKIAMVTVFEFMHLHYMQDWERAPEDWKHYQHKPDGTRGVKGLCWNTGYGEFVLAQIREVFSTYPTVGLYVDMLDYPGVELCPGCRRRFIVEMGEEPPTAATDPDTLLFKRYRLWTFRETARFLREIRRVVQEHVPEATVLNNHHHLLCDDPYEIAGATDYIATDPGVGFGWRSTARNAHTAPYFRAVSEGKPPFDILYDPILSGLGLLQVLPRDPFLAVTASSLAHGGYPCPSSMWAKDGSLNSAAVAVSREVWDHVGRVKAWVGGGPSLNTAGVYLSQESQYFYASPGDKTWSPSGRYLDEYHGALLMLQQEHVLTDVLTRNHLPKLSDYRVVYLPNVVCLSEAEVDAFREYVHGGGTLVASYRASLMDEWGRPQENFRLADVFGVDWTGEKMEPDVALQMNVAPSERFPFLTWENPSVTVNQASLLVRARPGATVLATLHDRYHRKKGPNEFRGFHNAFVVDEPCGAALVENRFGKGRAIYFAPKVFSAYVFKGVPEIRKLAARWCVSDALSRAPLSLQAPSSVEMTAIERPDEGRWIVHLVNYQSVPGLAHFESQSGGVVIPLTEDVLPVYDLALTARPGGRALRRATLQPDGLDLPFESGSGEVRLRIPKLHTHSVVVLDF